MTEIFPRDCRGRMEVERINWGVDQWCLCVWPKTEFKLKTLSRDWNFAYLGDVKVWWWWRRGGLNVEIGAIERSCGGSLSHRPSVTATKILMETHPSWAPRQCQLLKRRVLSGEQIYSGTNSGLAWHMSSIQAHHWLFIWISGDHMNVMTIIFLMILIILMKIMMSRMMTMKTWPGGLTRQCAWGGLVIQWVWSSFFANPAGWRIRWSSLVETVPNQLLQCRVFKTCQFLPLNSLGLLSLQNPPECHMISIGRNRPNFECWVSEWKETVMRWNNFIWWRSRWPNFTVLNFYQLFCSLALLWYVVWQ